MYQRFCYIVLLLSVATSVQSEVALSASNRGVTGIAPLYFGPNAFPIPDMSDGRTHRTLHLELAADGYWGYYGDRTVDVFARVSIPLFTPRANLTVWMPVMEWYHMSEERRKMCRVEDTTFMRGHEAGDVYVSTDIHILQQRRICPDLSLRASIKTASGNGFAKARHYDAPGYWFDVTIGKSLYISRDKVSSSQGNDALLEMRLSGNVGFLCWQTNNGRQNDAVMYGAQLLMQHKYVSWRTTWGCYLGWEYYGDRPMIIKTQLSGHIKGFEPYVQYQYGIRDYPFHQLKIGLAYHIAILSSKSRLEKKH